MVVAIWQITRDAVLTLVARWRVNSVRSSGLAWRRCQKTSAVRKLTLNARLAMAVDACHLPSSC